MSLWNITYQFLCLKSKYYTAWWFPHTTWPPAEKVHQVGHICTHDTSLCHQALEGLPDSGVPQNQRPGQLSCSPGTVSECMHQPGKVVAPQPGFPPQSDSCGRWSPCLFQQSASSYCSQKGERVGCLLDAGCAPSWSFTILYQKDMKYRTIQSSILPHTKKGIKISDLFHSSYSCSTYSAAILSYKQKK